MGGELKRIPQHELLDEDSLSPEEAVESLRDLRTINRWFGGVSTTAFLLRQAMDKCGMSSATVLEVAAGDGYSVDQAARRLKAEGLDVSPLCMDRRRMQPGASCCQHSMVGDALKLSFGTASFDFVSCGLFVHHLLPLQVIDFVNGALRVARHAVLINDLRRSPLHLAMVYAWWPIFHSPISRVDGVASVRQAYTPEELRELMMQTNAASLEIRKRFLFRMGAIAWK
jgi:ubiquinone/menaquinone biosynthesis C-methylase UbiE